MKKVPPSNSYVLRGWIDGKPVYRADGCNGYYWQDRSEWASREPWVEQHGKPYAYGSSTCSLAMILIVCLGDDIAIDVLDGESRELLWSAKPDDWRTRFLLRFLGYGRSLRMIDAA